MSFCGHCDEVVTDPESCWYCLDDLCPECWEKYGHCGEPEAIEYTERARRWKPGDPLLDWRMGWANLS